MRTEAGIHVAIAAVLTAVAAAIFVSLWVGGGPVQGAEHDPAADLSPAPPASVGMQSQDPVADLVLIKEVAPRRVRPGSKVTYTISVTNLGPGSATAVTLIDTLPEGTSPAKGNCEGSVGSNATWARSAVERAPRSLWMSTWPRTRGAVSGTRPRSRR